jgi:hypothetical protein
MNILKTKYKKSIDPGKNRPLRVWREDNQVMPSSKNLIIFRIKGSSIMEVLIALAITSFCASLAIVIYLNIQKSSLPFFKIKAIELAELYMKETLDKSTFFEESYTAEEFTAKKTVGSDERFPDCYRVRIIVFDASKKKLYELQTLVYSTFYK